ncbi:hypothetical protein QTP86_016826 [Hemibagrus guttatus]|nr:hypothetical protein QTP86_016826 [Hemibagrus guttatus]
MDPASPGGLLHSPGSFALGPNRGFLHYPGQPLSCWKCGAAGHTKEACTGRRCRLCGSEEHQAAECSTPKTCSLCGSEKHLFRQCPSRKGTFASLFSGGARNNGGGSGGAGWCPAGGKAIRGGSGRHCDICGPLASFGGDHHRGGLEILEGQQETPRAVQPDWALMDFSDGLEEEGESEQELDRVGEAGRPKGGQIRATDLTADDRVPKRAHPEVVREFEIMAVVEAVPTGVESEERGDYSQVGADNLGQPGGGGEVCSQDEEGWTRVLARKTRSSGGKGRGTPGSTDHGEC